MDATFTVEDELLLIAGSLDLYSAEPLRDALLQILAQSAFPKLNLAAVESCDLACLQLIGSAVRTAAAQGTPLTLAASAEPVALSCRQLGTSVDELFQGGC